MSDTSTTDGGAATATTDTTANGSGGGDATRTNGNANGNANGRGNDDGQTTTRTSGGEYDLLTADELGALSDPGKKALQTERAARRDAERRLTEQGEQLRTFQDRDKSELQLAQEGKAMAETDRDEWKGKFLRLKVAADKKLPAELADLLQGDDEEKLAAHAETLLRHVKTVTSGGGGGSTDNGHDQGARSSTTPPSMNDLIRQRLGVGGS